MTTSPLTDSSPDFREARAAMARGRLCRYCGVGYRTAVAGQFNYCPNAGCPTTAWMGHSYRRGPLTWRERPMRRVAVDLSRVVLTPAPASDVVWVWLEVTA